jgi:Tol biopolymer transport system component
MSGLIRRVSVFVLLLVFVSACFQPPPQSPEVVPELPGAEETPLLNDTNIDQATDDLGVAGTLEGTTDDSGGITLSGDEAGIGEAPNATDLSPQAVLPGAVGLVVYTWNNSADTTQSWRIYSQNQATDVTTLLYGGLREIDSVAVSGDGTKLIVAMRETSNVTSDFEIYQITLAPLTVTQLTNNTTADTNVSMSADASKYVWEGDGTTAGIRNIFLRNNVATPATTTALAPSFSSTQPTITGNGRFIVLIRPLPFNHTSVYIYEQATNVYTLWATTGTSTTDPGYTLTSPSLSNDKSRMVFLRKAPNAPVANTKYRVLVRNVSDLSLVTSINSATPINHPHLSADGNYLTYAVQEQGKFVLITRNLTTNIEVKRVETNANLGAPYWQQPDELAPATKTIGAAGGDLLNGRALIQVPANALSSDVSFTIQKLENLPAPLPNGLSRVAAYKFSSTATADFNSQITMVIPADVATASPANEVITELYVWDAVNNKYEKLRIGEADAGFLLEPNKLSDSTLVIGRTTVAALTTQCTAQGGQFNGKYCQLPFSAAGAGLLTAQVAGRNYTVLSINVGNFSRSGTLSLDYCLRYAVKLCSYAVEERIRTALVQANADIIAIQEIWHDDCQFVGEPGVLFANIPQLLYNTDRVCFPSPRVGLPKQIERLLVDNPTTKESRYEWRCTQPVALPLNTVEGGAKTINGYECVAVRKEFFELAAQSPQPIQPPCDPNNADPTQNYLGRDTGFQVETVKLKNPIGEAQYAEFDLVNAHMYKALGGGAAECRQVQLSALQRRYRSVGTVPVAKRLLLMGDFNTDPLKNANIALNDVGRNQFNRQFSLPDVAVDLAGPYFKMAYMLSNPSEATLRPGIGPLAAFSLDHVLSNFADGPCARRQPIQGLDHLSTLCTLTGFDSGTANFLMLLWNQDNPTVNYELWNGLVRPARKGVWLTYARVTYPSLGRHVISGVPNNNLIVLEVQACPRGSSRILAVPGVGQLDPGQTVALPEQRFRDFLSICQ